MYVYTCAAIDDSNTSFSLTDTETTPFLYVDLGTPRGFHHVRVLANEAHTNLADGYQILIANTPRINASDMKNCTSILRPLSGSINEVACAGEGYRYVMIVLNIQRQQQTPSVKYAVLTHTLPRATTGKCIAALDMECPLHRPY